MAKAAVFLDRDGTINEEVGHLRRMDQLRLMPGAAEGIALLGAHQFKVFVTTNQAAVARGWLSEPKLQRIHERLLQQLRAAGAMLDGIYYCPHHPTEGRPPYRVECECRKPRPGMLVRAARDWGLMLDRSVLVGDKLSDLAAGRAAGCRVVLVRTGYGNQAQRALAAVPWKPDWIANDLKEAAEWIVSQTQEP